MRQRTDCICGANNRIGEDVVRKFLTFCLLLSAVFSGDSFAQGVNTTKFVAEGQFLLRSQEIMTGNVVIPKVILNAEVSYRLSTLMGEPVANYALKWDLLGLNIVPGKGRSEITISAAEAREYLGTAVNQMEISLKGLAYAKSLNTASPLYRERLTLDFDTGAAVRAGKQSWNVAGSPNWGRYFLDEGAPCDGPTASIFSVSTGGARTWVAAEIAKQAFRVADFSLDYKAVCKRGTSFVGLDTIVSAIEKSCASSKVQAAWCPGKKEASSSPKESGKTDKGIADLLDGGKSSNNSSDAISDLLDEKAEAPRVASKLADLRKTYRLEAESACRKSLQEIEACFARNGCAIQLPENVTVQQCDSIPGKPSYGKLRLSNGTVCGADCQRRIREEDDRDYARAMDAWNAKYGNLENVCKSFLDSRRRIQSCRKENQPSCNPDGHEKLDDCVSQRMKNFGPSERDAKDAVRKEWQNKAKRPAAQQTRNFLD